MIHECVKKNKLIIIIIIILLKTYGKHEFYIDVEIKNFLRSPKTSMSHRIIVVADVL